MSTYRGLVLAACVAVASLVASCSEASPPPRITPDSGNALELAPEQGVDYIKTHLNGGKETFTCDDTKSTPVTLNLEPDATVMRDGASMTVTRDKDSRTIIIQQNKFVSSMVVNGDHTVKVPIGHRTDETLMVKLRKKDFGGDITKIDVCYHKP